MAVDDSSPFFRNEYDRYSTAHKQYWQAKLGDPVRPKERALLHFWNSLLHVNHHDEYYSILDLRGLKMWHHGIKRCLGYDTPDQQSIALPYDIHNKAPENLSWNHYNMLQIIHPRYRQTYIDWSRKSYELLYQNRVALRSLSERYIINIPVQKANKNYVWVKQMTMPWQVDQNGAMISHISSFTIVSRFQGFRLPVVPRFYDKDGQRRVELEKALFDWYIQEKKFNLPNRLKNLVQTVIDIDMAKPDTEKAICFEKHKIPITLQEIATKNDNKSVKVLYNYTHEILNQVEDAFKMEFTNYYDASMFLKAIRYVRPSNEK